MNSLDTFASVNRVGRRLPGVFSMTPNAVALFEITLLVASMKDVISLQAFITVHLALVAFLGCWALAAGSKGDDISLPLLCFFSALVFGPVGAIGGALLTVRCGSSEEEKHVLEQWYARLRGRRRPSPASEIYSRIVNNRVRRLDVAPEEFAAVVRQGSLRQVQTILGRIALDYHPEYFPFLEAALQSPEASIRVQAAATIAKLRSQVKARLKAFAEARPAQADEISASLKEARACMDSRLLERSDVRKIRALVKEARERLIEIDPARAEEHAADLCELLFEEGDYAAAFEKARPLSNPPQFFKHLQLSSGARAQPAKTVKNGSHADACTGVQEPAGLAAAVS